MLAMPEGPLEEPLVGDVCAHPGDSNLGDKYRARPEPLTNLIA